MTQKPCNRELAVIPRFEFGKNWQYFLTVLNDDRIAEAEHSLQTMLEIETLVGQSFLDIGSGSGLFSLAAMRLGAECVHSFDYDAQSVACTQELKRRYFPNADHWTIESGDILDADYLHGLGQWDIVYSWGVLHHTGEMWRALRNVALLVREGGILFTSIYNDQGIKSKCWRAIKAFYNRGILYKWLILSACIPCFILGGIGVDCFRLQDPFRRYQTYKKLRGMSIFYDWLDWLGGYPFEVATPEQVCEFYAECDFVLMRLKTYSRKLGCNEFIFRKLCSTSSF